MEEITKEMKAATEEKMILNVEKADTEKKTDGDAEETKGASKAQANQTELLQQINMKMDALLAANNISL